MAFISNKIVNCNRMIARICRESQIYYNSCNKGSIKMYLYSVQKTANPKYYCTSNTKVESLDDFRNREEKKEEVFHHGNNSNQTHNSEHVDPQACDQVEKTKREILQSAIQFIPLYGFTKEAISKGAETMNYPSTTHGLFPKGGIELIQYFNMSCNKNLIEELRKEEASSKVTPKEFLKKAIKLRLLMIQPYLSSWPQVLAVMSLPPNVPTSIANLLTLVDDICYHAGDRSVDFNWYIRRVGLAGIYKSTELYMLQDSSQNFENTWKFLDQRLDEASIAHNFLIKSEEATNNIQNTVFSVFVTARNILGIH